MRIVLFTAVLGILVAIGVLISVIIKSSKGDAPTRDQHKGGHGGDKPSGS